MTQKTHLRSTTLSVKAESVLLLKNSESQVILDIYKDETH